MFWSLVKPSETRPAWLTLGDWSGAYRTLYHRSNTTADPMVEVSDALALRVHPMRAWRSLRGRRMGGWEMNPVWS